MKSLSLLFLLLFSNILLAENRVCLIKNQDVLVSDEVQHKFSFGLEKPGQAIFQNYLIMFFSRSGYIHLVVKNTKSGSKISSQYEKGQKHIALNITPHFRLNCYTDSRFAKMHSLMEENKFDATLADIAELKDYKSKIALKINKTLTFKYNQKLVQKGMRPILFQYGNVYTADDPRDEDKNHCTFRVGIKVNKDIKIYSGTLLKVKEVNEFNNSSKRFVMSYSFVDTTAGKKTIENTEYSPLSLECSIRNQDKLTYNLFKKITGERIEIGIKNK